ncbi:MAG: excinuclease ABC subunit UvrA [Bacteroidota bacterium]
MTEKKSNRTNSASDLNGRSIIIRGARVHNLKNINLDLPRNKLIVFTGVSGSGKSSLAFDTIYAEGQRRYVESLSAYARQFLERMDRPDVDLIQGISPAMAIEQKTNVRNPRSTVGTTTEIYDYLRLLFARIGETRCMNCGNLVRRDSVRTVLQRVKEVAAATPSKELKLYVLFPLHDHPNRTVAQELENLKKRGFFRLVVGDELIDLTSSKYQGKTKKGVHVLVDRIIVRGEEAEKRLADSVEMAFNEGEGYVVLKVLETGEELKFNNKFECSQCGFKYEEPEPRLFSFNNPYGACPKCQGFGRSVGIDLDLVVPNREKTIREGAIQPWNFPRWRENLHDLMRVAGEAGVRVDVPFRVLTDDELKVLMDGYEGFDGLIEFFKYIERKSYKIHYRVFLSRYRGYTTCDACNGGRLRPEALSVFVGGKNIRDVVQMSIADADGFFKRLQLTAFQQEVAKRILDELQKRLKYLVEVGIGYLTLDRLSSTLSGGEAQRINLATSLGSSLVGSVYILDEPSIGLHPRDNSKLINILRSLRDVGNTVIVVEHDADMMKASDLIVDLGPRAGEHGGEIIIKGDLSEVLKDEDSLTGKYLSGALSIPIPVSRRRGNGNAIVIRGAAEHNLKRIDVRIPLNVFVCVTGVSGSGKSTLIHEIFYGALKKQKGGYDGKVGKFAKLEGAEYVDAVELVDQSPIGRTPRSNPITYIKAFDLIRDLFASTQQSKIRGFKPGHFSFNVPGGRCETCEGDGFQKVEMQFLADLYIKCDVCKGKRYKSEVLDIHYRGKNIDEVLNLTVTEAIAFFQGDPRARRTATRLKVLDEVGLGYLRLGQSATTLSGGEAQRVKLAAHLAAQEKEGHTLFIFDEPTTGLHFDDIAKLLRCFDALIEAGNTIVTIEHNMDVIKCADYLIDLGPEGGEEGGYVVASGTPDQVAKSSKSHTGRFLRAYLRNSGST